MKTDNFVDISEVLDSLRSVKSQEEIELIRKGTHIADVGGYALVDVLEEGKTEMEVSGVSLLAMEKEYAKVFPGLETFGTLFYCNSGENTLYCHGGSRDSLLP